MYLAIQLEPTSARITRQVPLLLTLARVDNVVDTGNGYRCLGNISRQNTLPRASRRRGEDFRLLLLRQCSVHTAYMYCWMTLWQLACVKLDGLFQALDIFLSWQENQYVARWAIEVYLEECSEGGV